MDTSGIEATQALAFDDDYEEININGENSNIPVSG